jgi:hypothetical protein
VEAAGRPRTRHNTGRRVNPTMSMAYERDGAPASFAPQRPPA